MENGEGLKSLLHKYSTITRISSETELEAMHNKRLNGGQACKPDSVERAKHLRLRTLAIIPLGPGSHLDSSSLPEGPNELGSSPLLFGLAPRGVCRASAVASGAVGSYPTVSPLPCSIAFDSPLARVVFKAL
jgi:hypothetical protein